MSWTEPASHYRTGVDSHACYARLAHDGELLSRWPAAPDETAPTDCFRLGHKYWIWQPGVGGIQFAADRPEFIAFPAPDTDPSWFDQLVHRRWLPAVYQVWGRQVLHASAVLRSTTGAAIALAGPSGAGKSTLAFGLARRAEWRQIADDTLAFSCEQEHIALHPLRNDPRLRPESLAHYGPTGPSAGVDWPAEGLRLGRVYFVQGDPNAPSIPTLARVSAADGYLLLLEQAHAFTLRIAEHNQQLMRDYLQLAAAVPMFRLQYRRSFDVIDEVFDALQEHVTSVLVI